MDSQPVSRDKYSSCIENQNHVQVQKIVLNPYLETNMAAAKKSQLEGVSLRENWVRQFLFLFLNSGEFLNARIENRFNQIKPNNLKESHLTYFNQTSLYLNQLLCNPSSEYSWGEGWLLTYNPRMRLIHLKRYLPQCFSWVGPCSYSSFLA